jgi:hypothetical protein
LPLQVSFRSSRISQKSTDACRVEFALSLGYIKGKIEHLIGKILGYFLPLDNMLKKTCQFARWNSF